ncbi:PREDICTED: indole glucosinolate O-methyltransferase 4-like [Tarenaya hassleriana]|uniref:indole glucosinolate O-methyltransferase 4-like n=1 Tax=Tarenaya hassleriana TaxID=28532 RepID=UPI00053C0A98|nr:PREDICTED: indole glucosinolate O-methyltransferase 4-like [Tarenaya hassleriana]
MNKVINFQEQRNANSKQESDEELGGDARRLAFSGVLPWVLQSAIELGLIDALHVAAAEGGSFLSPSEISLRLPCVPTNPNAPDMLNRVLRLLASYSIVECRRVRTGEKVEIAYRAKPICRFLVKDGDQDGSFGPLLMMLNCDLARLCWSQFNELLLKGGNVFEMACGMSSFEYSTKDKGFNVLFQEAMSGWTKLVMSKVVGIYRGFQGIKVLVDVGGGTGATLRLIAAKYPNIKAVNFDMPHVVAIAPSHPDIEHIGGDMFTSVPKGDAIILRNILHDWDDENCLKILKNCFEALQSSGKLIVVESVFPDEPKSDVSSKIATLDDIGMLISTPGGKQRTRAEFKTLANDSGFGDCQFICCAYGTSVIVI